MMEPEGRTRVNRPLFVLGATVALIIGISSAFLQVETVKPPYRVGVEEAVELDRLTNRQARIARLMRNNEGDVLQRMTIQAADLAIVEQRLASEEALPTVRAAAKEALGNAYTGTFLSAADIIVTASTPGSVSGANVVVVPHSRSELRRIRNAIRRQIVDRELEAEAEAHTVARRGNVIVSVCALEDTPLDLSSYPSSAVEWEGACADALDDLAAGPHTQQPMKYSNNIIIL